MDLKINAESAKVTLATRGIGDVEVELEDVDREELLDAIKDADGGLDQIVDHFGWAALLGAIGRDQAKEHFDLVEREE
jgi:hypothetical protein